MDYVWLMTRDKTIPAHLLDNLHDTLRKTHPAYARSNFYYTKQGDQCSYPKVAEEKKEQ